MRMKPTDYRANRTAEDWDRVIGGQRAEIERLELMHKDLFNRIERLKLDLEETIVDKSFYMSKKTMDMLAGEEQEFREKVEELKGKVEG